MLEAEVVAVELDDVDGAGQPAEQRAGEPVHTTSRMSISHGEMEVKRGCRRAFMASAERVKQRPCFGTRELAVDRSRMLLRSSIVST